jgi:hypothetical protein
MRCSHAGWVTGGKSETAAQLRASTAVTAVLVLSDTYFLFSTVCDRTDQRRRHTHHHVTVRR